MSDNDSRQTSQHMKSAASYGIPTSKKAVNQMSPSANAAKHKRKALEEEREAKEAAEEKKLQNK
jgi:hypothetical protein